MEDKAYNLIKKYYEYTKEVKGLESCLNNIKDILKRGKYKTTENRIVGTKNSGAPYRSFCIKDNLLIFENINGDSEIKKYFKKIDENIWVKAEKRTQKRRKNNTKVVYSASLFMNGREISKTVNIFSFFCGSLMEKMEERYYLIGTDLYCEICLNGTLRNVEKYLDFNEKEINLIDLYTKYKCVKLNDFDVEDYVMKKV